MINTLTFTEVSNCWCGVAVWEGLQTDFRLIVSMNIYIYLYGLTNSLGTIEGCQLLRVDGWWLMANCRWLVAKHQLLRISQGAKMWQKSVVIEPYPISCISMVDFHFWPYKWYTRYWTHSSKSYLLHGPNLCTYTCWYIRKWTKFMRVTDCLYDCIRRADCY